MELVTITLMVWALSYALENAKAQWRHTRGQHARAICAQHPMWHPRKVRRHAQWRALAWWAHEARDAFPSIRHAWAEDREHVRYLREHERISREARLAEWRNALADIRAQRAGHAAAVRRGETTASFGQWYQRTRSGDDRAPAQPGSASTGRPRRPAGSPEPQPRQPEPVGEKNSGPPIGDSRPAQPPAAGAAGDGARQ
ncbi:MAG: hypothetical protein J2P26_10785, partial [Nocardiopsaceae bacterium]|nr:hypothetical protein [Nocardiopsaceae bacterium]